MSQRAKRSLSLPEVERSLRRLGFDGKVAGLASLLNIEQKYLFPYALPMGQQYDPGRHEELLAALAAPAREDRARALALSGRLKRLLSRVDAALADLDESVDLDPRDPEALAWRGELLIRLGKYDLGLGDLENAAGQRGDAVMPWLWMAAAQLARNESEAGAASLERALAADPRSVTALLLRGRLRLEAKDAAAARADFEAAARLAPACVGAKVLLGRALLAAGERRGAERAFAAAVRLDPDAKSFYGLLISGEGLLENDAKTLAALDAFLKKEPKAAWAWALRGDLVRTPAFGRTEEGIADLRRAAKLDPKSPWIRAVLGRARVQYFFIKEGVRDIAAAVKMDPSCGWLRMWQGEAMRRAKDPAAALRHFKAAVKLAPDMAQCRLWMGRVLAAKKAHEAALPHYARAAALDPAYGYAYAKRGESLVELGRWREAVADFDRALNLKRVASEEWIRGQRARALWALGDYAGALEDLARGIRKDLKKCWFPLEYGAPALDPRSWGVLETLNEALAQNPNAGWLYAWRGAVKLSLDKPAEGESDLTLATRVAPDFAWAWGWRGRMRWQTGRPQEAEADLDEALRLDPRTTWLWTWRAELKAGQGRGAEALADAEAARASAPESPEAWYSRGEALRALKRFAEAKESYDRALFFDPRHRFAYIGRGLAKGELGDQDGQVEDFRKVAQLAPDLFRKTVEALAGVEGAEGMEEFVRALMTPDPEPPKGGLKEMAATGDIPS